MSHSGEVTEHHLTKRLRMIEGTRKTEDYIYYKLRKTDDMPDTPKPEAGNKANWERRAFAWTSAMREVSLLR